MSAILDKTLKFLLEQPGVSGLAIRALYLNNYFTVVELDDASVGACMSSYKLGAEELSGKQQEIRSLLNDDPLLLRFSQRYADSDDVASSIRAATISALSAPFLRVEDDSCFIVRNNFPHYFFRDVQYAVVIGYGGLLNYLVRQTNIPRIHVSDLRYEKRRARLDAKTMLFRKDRPGIQLSVSDGSDSDDHIQKADLVTITGSTLTNNTLEGLLQSAQNCKKVVLQGQSASIHPKEFFAAGVNLVTTTIKTRDVAKAAFWDPTGNALRPLMEGGLPWAYIWPKNSKDGNTDNETEKVLANIAPDTRNPHDTKIYSH